jgi:hypothetical protein
MSREIDLDEIEISPEVYIGWTIIAEKSAGIIKRLLENKKNFDIIIHDEKCLLNDDGTITIFWEVEGILKTSMTAPADQWRWKEV